MNQLLKLIQRPFMISLRASDRVEKRYSSHPSSLISNYQKLDVLGKGTYGTVYSAVDKTSGTLYAIKKIKKVVIKDEGPSRYFIRQISILKSLNHPCIVRLCDYNVTEDKDYGYLIFQYMRSDLAKQLQKGKNQKKAKIGGNAPRDSVFQQRIKTIFKNLLLGIHYCHSRSYFHRDIKPSNILVNQDYSVIKIADFGVAIQKSPSKRQYSMNVGTQFYRAPEVLFNNQNYGPEVDIWGVALVVAECITGQALLRQFHQVSDIQFMNSFYNIGNFQVAQNSHIFSQLIRHSEMMEQELRIQDKVPELKVLGQQGLNLLNSMLLLNPKKRITASQALNSPYFKQEEFGMKLLQENSNL